MPWRYIDPFYEKLSRHTTIYGKYWLIFITVFRLTVIPFADNCWSDEQKEFKCNTQEPGCNNVCFNRFAPINSVRLWSMQILAITAPLALYIVFVFHLAEERRQKEKSDAEEGANKSLSPAASKARKRNLAIQQSRIHIGCPAHEKLNKQIILPDYLNAVRETDNREKLIWRMYIANVFLRTVLDIVFIWLQWEIYPYKAIIPEVFECTRAPCPHTVECWPSRVKEKTIFFHYMYIAASITCLINVAEICYIGPRRIFNAFTCCVSTSDLSPGFEEKTISEHNSESLASTNIRSATDDRQNTTDDRRESSLQQENNCSLPGQSPSPVLKMPPKKFYQYAERYYERRPTLYEENPPQIKRSDHLDGRTSVRNLAVDQMDQLRRGSFLETSGDRETYRNQNNNVVLSMPNKEDETYKNLPHRIYYNCDANQKK